MTTIWGSADIKLKIIFTNLIISNRIYYKIHLYMYSLRLKLSVYFFTDDQNLKRFKWLYLPITGTRYMFLKI